MRIPAPSQIEKGPCGLTLSLRPGLLSNHTQLIQEAIECARAGGGGTVRLGPGDYHCGTIVLLSRVTLHLAKGARLVASANVNDYLAKEGDFGARIGGGVASALIYAENADQVALTGEGTIDGSGHTFWEKNEMLPDWAEAKKPLGTFIPATGYKSHPRPRSLVFMAQCQDVKIAGLQIQNSPAWTIHLLACTNILVQGITLRGALHGCNTDGIDLDGCRDVLVEDCDIFTGDDAIALKNTNTWGLKRPSRRIIVRRCRLRSITHGFTIGTETQDDFEDITLCDSQIEKAGDYRTLTGIGLSTFDGGAIRRVQIRNVTISDSIAPIQVRVGKVGRGQAYPVPGEICDILFDKISIQGAFGNSLLAGLPLYPLRNVQLRQVELEFNGVVESSAVMVDVPELESEFPINQVWRFLPTYGFYCRHVRALEFADIKMTAPFQEKRPALLLSEVSEFNCSSFNCSGRGEISLDGPSCSFTPSPKASETVGVA